MLSTVPVARFAHKRQQTSTARHRSSVRACTGSAAANEGEKSPPRDSTPLVIPARPQAGGRRASGTASMVAAARGAGIYLPKPLQLIEDPYGFELAGGGMLMSRWLAENVRLLWSWMVGFRTPFGSRISMILSMQVRTRLIDDEIRSFAQKGGKQVVIYGAGFDARAIRMRADVPAAVTWFEVDAPASQKAKRAALTVLAQHRRAPSLGQFAQDTRAGADSGHVRFLPWDFEQSPPEQIPDALRALGLDTAAPTLVVAEGLLYYLDNSAVRSVVETTGKLGGPGSVAVFEYPEARARAAFENSRNFFAVLTRVAMRAMWALLGFGHEPMKFPGWESTRVSEGVAPGGWSVRQDASLSELLDRYFADVPADTMFGARTAADTVAGVRAEAEGRLYLKSHFAVVEK